MSSPTDRTIQAYLAQHVTPPLAAVIGARLVRAVYWDLSEMTLEEASDPLYQTGYQIELRFSDDKSVYVSWWQRAVFDADVAIWTQRSPIYPETSAEYTLVNETPLWKSVIGTVLRGVVVLGWSFWAHTPQMEALAIRLCFETGNIYLCIGDGSRNSLSVGDDIMPRSEDQFNRWPYANEGKVLWSAGEIG